MISKIRIGWGLVAVGSTVMAAEFIAAQYFSGRPFGDYLLYDREHPQTEATIDVAAGDLPIRAVLTATGQRPMGAEGNSGLPRAKFVVQYGDGWADQPIHFDFPADKKISRTGSTSTSQSFLLNNVQPGTWRLKLAETSFRQFKAQTVMAELRAGSRAVNKLLVGIGIAIALPGMIVLWWPSKKAD